MMNQRICVTQLLGSNFGSGFGLADPALQNLIVLETIQPNLSPME